MILDNKKNNHTLAPSSDNVAGLKTHFEAWAGKPIANEDFFKFMSKPSKDRTVFLCAQAVNESFLGEFIQQKY